MVQESHITFTGADLHAHGAYRHLCYRRKEKDLSLQTTTPIEDDAPGKLADVPVVLATANDMLSKELFIEDAVCFKARLLLYLHVDTHSKDEEHCAVLTVNGTIVEADLTAGWCAIELDPECLQNGTNAITITRAIGSAPLCIPVVGRGSIIENKAERFRIPQRSHYSSDAGVTWEDTLTTEHILGECLVRLHLDQFSKKGDYESVIFDFADPLNHIIPKSPVALDTFTAKMDATIPADTGLTYYYRSGTTPEYHERTWRDWQICKPLVQCALDGRYFQGKIIFETASPLKTPRVHGIHFDLGIKRLKGPGAHRIHIEEYHPISLAPTIIPFRYENMKHRYLTKLRYQYLLDDVVEGVESSFERMVRLLHWVAARPECSFKGTVDEWNALEILGRSDGDDVTADVDRQGALVLIQACLALGIQARYVGGSLAPFIPGHAVVECWSDDHTKWVLLDPLQDCYYLHADTLVPMHMLEMQQVLVAHFSESTLQETFEADRAVGNYQKVIEHYKQAGIVLRQGSHIHAENLVETVPTIPAGNGIYMLPRNNFLTEKYPIPRMGNSVLSSGWHGWVRWHDAATSPELQVAGYVHRLSDWYWNLNVTAVSLEAGGAPGLLQVYCRSKSMGFSTFVAIINTSEPEEMPACFEWRLQNGLNILEVYARTILGTTGPVQRIKIQYSEE